MEEGGGKEGEKRKEMGKDEEKSEWEVGRQGRWRVCGGGGKAKERNEEKEGRVTLNNNVSSTAYSG